jgi:ribosomal protein S25
LNDSLTKTAKKLKIKLSTAKLILKKFKKTGILMDKKLRNTKKEVPAPPASPIQNLVIPTFEVK